MVKKLFVIIVFISVGFSCDCLKTTNGPEEPNGNVLEGNLSFRSIIHSKGYIRDSDQTQLIVWRSIEDQEAFLDTTLTATEYVGFNSYEDSMVVGIIYGELISVSVTFSIDSVVATPSTQEIIIYSQLHFPIREMLVKGFHCHLIAIPKSNFDITMDEINVTYEATLGEIISYNTLFNFRHSLKNATLTPYLIILSNKQEEITFLDTTEVYHPFLFPEFSSYDDSILVGVLMPEKYTSIYFAILSIISCGDTIEVSTQYWVNSYGASFPDTGHPCHFVSIPKKYEDSVFVLNHMGYLVSEIED